MAWHRTRVPLSFLQQTPGHAKHCLPPHHERARASVWKWEDGQALGFSGLGAAGCCFPRAHGARGGLGGRTSGFPAQFRFAGALEGREQCQGWPGSESKPPQSRAPQREPGPISQREIGSQFHQLGEVTLRLALSLSAAVRRGQLPSFSWAKAENAAGASLHSASTAGCGQPHIKAGFP